MVRGNLKRIQPITLGKQKQIRSRIFRQQQQISSVNNKVKKMFETLETSYYSFIQRITIYFFNGEKMKEITLQH